MEDKNILNDEDVKQVAGGTAGARHCPRCNHEYSLDDDYFPDETEGVLYLICPNCGRREKL